MVTHRNLYTRLRFVKIDKTGKRSRLGHAAVVIVLALWAATLSFTMWAD